MAGEKLISIKQELLSDAGTSETLSTARACQASTSEPPMSLVDLEERILQLCEESSKGITDTVIMMDQPHLDAEKIVKALQRLLSQVCWCGWY